MAPAVQGGMARIRRRRGCSDRTGQAVKHDTAGINNNCPKRNWIILAQAPGDLSSEAQEQAALLLPPTLPPALASSSPSPRYLLRLAATPGTQRATLTPPRETQATLVPALRGTLESRDPNSASTRLKPPLLRTCTLGVASFPVTSLPVHTYILHLYPLHGSAAVCLHALLAFVLTARASSYSRSSQPPSALQVQRCSC